MEALDQEEVGLRICRVVEVRFATYLAGFPRCFSWFLVHWWLLPRGADTVSRLPLPFHAVLGVWFRVLWNRVLGVWFKVQCNCFIASATILFPLLLRCSFPAL